nr:PREDICTED: protein MLP1 homolog [Musa acuminata subsp. malaccensis]
MEEVRATINSILEEQATLERELEACRSRLEILRERNSMFQEELAKAAADRRAPGTPSPPATDSRVGSTTASGQQMQSAGLQGGAKNGEEAQEGDR